MRPVTQAIDYLQRNATAPVANPAGTSVTAAAPPTRRLWQVRGVGRYVKYTPVAEDDARWRPPTSDLLTGLYGYRLPTAFAVWGEPQGIAVHLGVWSPQPTTAPGVMDRRAELVRSLLAGLNPTVDLAAVDADLPPAPFGGIAVGVPSAKPPARGDVAVSWDRLVRGLRGTTWRVLVLAVPVAEAAVAAMRDGLLNEIRAARTDAASEDAASPLADYYAQLLGVGVASCNEAAGIGAWRTAVYLLGDAEGYPRLTSMWRSVFSGPASLPEPVRVFDWPGARDFAAAWSLSDLEGAPGPTPYRRPLEYQTVLTSAQLAAYVHLPETETPGFSVDLVPRFDSVPRPRRGVVIGQVVDGDRPTSSVYRVPLRELTRHAFVGGVTGAGKTNTIVSLLTEADAAGVPFLVVEPAKTEYRALLAHPGIGPRLRVFTAGNDAVSPFRLNPFEVPDGVGVSQHLDLLRAVFSAAFSMWSPLPQVLERCLHAVYADRGWDLLSNGNSRLRGGRVSSSAFPTLTDLVRKVDDVVPALGYEPKIAGDIRAALLTRLDSLRTGGKGAMLDVARSMPMSELLGQPTVLELEAMGDESDKAFLMGLILVRLAEYRRAAGQQPDLTHLLVVEEAHRLLAHVAAPVSEESASPRAQAVETFSNLLSEIRVYGQGVVIADQVPVRLAPDVVKNTTVKIAHRIVAADDRMALGAAMAMDDAQTRGLTVLPAGRAAVFGEGDDAPMLIQVPLVKDALAADRPTDETVAEHMAGWHSHLSAAMQPREFCAETCASPQACAGARHLLDHAVVTRAVARTVLSTIEDPAALDRLWDDLLAVVRPRRPAGVDETALLNAFAGHAAQWYADRRGAQESWSYEDGDAFAATLCQVLLDRIAGRDPSARAILREQDHALQARTYAPYPYCDVICTQQPPVCIYRSAVADLVASGRFQPSWRAADAQDANSPGEGRNQTWELCQDAAYELIEFPEPGWPDHQRARVADSARRTSLCFEQQMLDDDVRKVPRTSRLVMAEVLQRAGVT